MNTLSEHDFWLFDLDGTVVDASWTYTRSVFDEVGTRLERNFSDTEAEILWHGLQGNRNPRFRSWCIDPRQVWDGFHTGEDPQRRAEATYLHYDAASVIRELLDNDIPVGVVTHCQDFLAQPVLSHLGIHNWFETVVTCTPDLGWKPDPAPVYHAIEQLSTVELAQDTGVLIGDSASDIGAAWNAGLTGVHVERHSPDIRGQCVIADHRVKQLTDLLN